MELYRRSVLTASSWQRGACLDIVCIMPSRAADWLRQAEHDLSLAVLAAEGSKYDWACFASQQAAEKALKALYQVHHSEGWGHSLDALLTELIALEPELSAFRDAAKSLDKHYIPARYPNGLPAGAPADSYTETEAERAIQHAQDFITFCKARCAP